MRSLKPAAFLLVGVLALAACNGDGGTPIQKWVVSANYDGSAVSLGASSRTAGAIDSLIWKNRQFIDATDHGRELQSALFLNGHGECENPTQAGSRSDGTGNKSSSQLLSTSVQRNSITARVRMAYWLAPGQSATCGNAVNTTVVSDVEHEYTATLTDNTIKHDVSYSLPRAYDSAVYEALTAYLPYASFPRFYSLDTKTQVLAEIGPGPGVLRNPIIIADATGNFALGVWSGLPGVTYNRWAFPDVTGPVSKWNCVFREKPVVAGKKSFTCYSIFGSLKQVQDKILALSSGK